MRGPLGIIITVAVAAIIGIGAYQLGVAHGAAGTGAAVAPGAYYPFFWGGFGFLFPLLFLLLIFGLARAAFWGGPRRGGYWSESGPPRFEEWHRRAHAGSDAPSASPGAPTGR